MTSGDYPMGGMVKLMDEALYGNDIMAEFDNGQVRILCCLCFYAVANQPKRKCPHRIGRTPSVPA